jgi:hypothetical protein
MKRFSEKLVAAAVFVTALGSTLVVLPLVTDNPALALDAGGPRGDHPKWAFPLPSERVEARIAYVRTALKITDAQAGAWNAVADVMRRQAKEEDAAIVAMRDHTDGDHTIIDRLEQHEKMMTKRAAELSELIAAAKPLYASLSPDQKKDADSLLEARFGGGGWGHHGPGHEGRGHDGPGRDGHGPGGPGPAQPE